MFNLQPPVLVTLALLCLGGCSRYQAWQFSLSPDNGRAKVDMDGLTLIFEGVPLDHPPGGHLGGATGSLTVSGTGTHSIKVTVAGNSFENSYADGVNTMSLEGYSLDLTDSGTRLQIGTQEFDLSDGKKAIAIAEDGTARIVME